MALARSFPIDVIRQRGDGTFSNPRDVGGVNRANGSAAGYMTILPGEEAEARGREPSENRPSYLADVPATSMTCAHRPGSAIGWAIYAAGVVIWLFGYLSAGHAQAFDW